MIANPGDNHGRNTLSYPELGRERLGLEHFAKMKSGSVKGARAPFSSVGGDNLFELLTKQACAMQLNALIVFFH